jgi:hypothetical protein
MIPAEIVVYPPPVAQHGLAEADTRLAKTLKPANRDEKMAENGAFSRAKSAIFPAWSPCF